MENGTSLHQVRRGQHRAFCRFRDDDSCSQSQFCAISQLPTCFVMRWATIWITWSDPHRLRGLEQEVARAPLFPNATGTASSAARRYDGGQADGWIGQGWRCTGPFNV